MLKRETRQHRITVKLNDEELKTLKNDADDEGMTISDYVRVKLFYEEN